MNPNGQNNQHQNQHNPNQVGNNSVAYSQNQNLSSQNIQPTASIQQQPQPQSVNHIQNNLQQVAQGGNINHPVQLAPAPAATSFNTMQAGATSMPSMKVIAIMVSVAAILIIGGVVGLLVLGNNSGDRKNSSDNQTSSASASNIEDQNSTEQAANTESEKNKQPDVSSTSNTVVSYSKLKQISSSNGAIKVSVPDELAKGPDEICKGVALCYADRKEGKSSTISNLNTLVFADQEGISKSQLASTKEQVFYAAENREDEYRKAMEDLLISGGILDTIEIGSFKVDRSKSELRIEIKKGTYNSGFSVTGMYVVKFGSQDAYDIIYLSDVNVWNKNKSIFEKSINSISVK